MFRQGNAPPPASKKFVDSLDDVQLVNDEGTDKISTIIWNLSLVYIGVTSNINRLWFNLSIPLQKITIVLYA